MSLLFITLYIIAKILFNIQHELLNQLRKVVTGRHILESCADSYIRLLKVATCIQEQNYKQSALEKLVNGFLYDLQVIFSPSKLYNCRLLIAATQFNCEVVSRFLVMLIQEHFSRNFSHKIVIMLSKFLHLIVFNS